MQTLTKLAADVLEVDEAPKVPSSMKDWFTPFPHQEAAAKRLFSNKGSMIMAHDVGVGKTVAAIYSAELLKEAGKGTNTLVIVPSGLRENFAKDGLEKFLKTPSYQIVGSTSEKSRPGYVRPDKIDPSKQYTVISYAMFRRDPKGFMARTGAKTIIADEFHRVRNESTSNFKALASVRNQANNFMGLTGSLVNNDPAEVASLLTIAEGRRFISPKEFKRRYSKIVGVKQGFFGGKSKVRALKNVEEMMELVHPRVHYVNADQLEGKTMPKKNITNVNVPMSDTQYDLYQKAMAELGPVKNFIMNRDENVTITEAKHVFGKIIQARRLTNSIAPGRKDVTPAQSAKMTPKLKRILDDTVAHLGEKGDNKVVLYSNLIRGGVDALTAGLTERGIDHSLFIGKGRELGGRKVTGKSRTKGIADFKSGKKRVVVLSSAGAEGLSLNNATAFYALDGHFNPERILQAEARAVRLGGQSDRLAENRNVDVRRYKSTVPVSKVPGFFGKLVGNKPARTTDQWMYDVAKTKHQKNQQFFSAIRNPKKHLYKYYDKQGKLRYRYPKVVKSENAGWLNKLWS